MGSALVGTGGAAFVTGSSFASTTSQPLDEGSPSSRGARPGSVGIRGRGEIGAFAPAAPAGAGTATAGGRGERPLAGAAGPAGAAGAAGARGAPLGVEDGLNGVGARGAERACGRIGGAAEVAAAGLFAGRRATPGRASRESLTSPESPIVAQEATTDCATDERDSPPLAPHTCLCSATLPGCMEHRRKDLTARSPRLALAPNWLEQ